MVTRFLGGIATAAFILAALPAHAQNVENVLMRRPLPGKQSSSTPTPTPPGEGSGETTAYGWYLHCDAPEYASCERVTMLDGGGFDYLTVAYSFCLPTQSAEKNAVIAAEGYNLVPGSNYDFERMCDVDRPEPEGQSGLVFIGASLCLDSRKEYSCMAVPLDGDRQPMIGDASSASTSKCSMQPENADYQTLKSFLEPMLSAGGATIVPPSASYQEKDLNGALCGYDPDTIETVYGSQCATSNGPATCQRFYIQNGTDIVSQSQVSLDNCESPKPASPAAVNILHENGYVPITSTKTIQSYCGPGAKDDPDVSDYAISGICQDSRAVYQRCVLITTTGVSWEVPCSNIPMMSGINSNIFTHQQDVVDLLRCGEPDFPDGTTIGYTKNVTKYEAPAQFTVMEWSRTRSRPIAAVVEQNTCIGRDGGGSAAVSCASTYLPGNSNPSAVAAPLYSVQSTISIPYQCTDYQGNHLPVTHTQCAQGRADALAFYMSEESNYGSFSRYATDTENGRYQFDWWIMPSTFMDFPPPFSWVTKVEHVYPAPVVVDDTVNRRITITETFPWNSNPVVAPFNGSAAKVETEADSNLRSWYGF